MSSGEGAAEGVAEAQCLGAKTSVWWDIENCQVPKGCDSYAIAQNISLALSRMNYRGPVTISAYGDTFRIPKNVQEALSSTGIALNHVPAGVKDASDKKILVDMLFWAVDNPAPANYLLISGDRDFSNALHQLRMRRYNILLAQPNRASAALVSAAKSVWLWTSLVSGGLPMSKGEPPQTVPNNNHFTMETQQDRTSESPHVSSYQQPAAISQSDQFPAGNQRPMGPAKVGGGIGDFKYKGKCVHKNLNQPSTTKTLSTPAVITTGVQECKSDDYLLQTDHYTQKWAFRKVPHEFYGANDQHPSLLLYASCSSAPNIFLGNVDPSKSATGSKQPNSQYPYPPRPRGFQLNSGNIIPPPPPPSSPPNVSSAASFPVQFRPDDRPSFSSSQFRSVSAPDISTLSMTEYPDYIQRSTTPGQQIGAVVASKPRSQEYSKPGIRNLSQRGPDFHTDAPPSRNASNGQPSDMAPTLSEQEQGLLGLVLYALNELKKEKITPVETNIADCLRFGNLKHHDIDVKKALNVAIESQAVVRHTLGGLHLYVNKGQNLWSCINPIGGNPNQYSKVVWNRIRKFLTSTVGQSALLSSSRRYEAALKFKHSCLQDLPLGDVIKILNMLITPKRWIKTHSSGWQPITITLSVVSKETNNDA